MHRWVSPCFLVPVAVATVSLAALVVLGWGGWPGTPGVAGLDFCEAHAVLIKQPANAFSNIGFIVVGLVIGWVAASERWQRDPQWQRNRMRSTVFYPTLYAAVATFLGPGSMAMHASTTAWGGKLDVYSMFLWIAFPVAYAITRLYDLPVLRFAALYGLLALVLGACLLIDLFPGTTLFGVAIAIFSAIELAVLRRVRDAHVRRGWLGVAAVAFAIAFAIWVPSHTGGPLCNPASLLQGHAAWHLLSAVSVGAIYLFYRSEQPQPALRPRAK